MSGLVCKTCGKEVTFGPVLNNGRNEWRRCGCKKK